MLRNSKKKYDRSEKDKKLNKEEILLNLGDPKLDRSKFITKAISKNQNFQYQIVTLRIHSIQFNPNH
jgi:hypothetical protein